MNILCTICARSGSKGLPNKNIKLMNGKPLIYYTINQAKKSNIFEDIVISTDSEKINLIGRKYGINTIPLRNKKLSGDKIAKIHVIRDAFMKAEKIFNKNYDLIFDLDVTSPLRNIQDIKNSLKLFSDNNCDNLLTVCHARKNPYFNMLEYKNGKLVKVKNNNININSRQQAPKVFEMNASIYIWKKSILFKKNPFYRKKTILYKMPFSRSIDIDTLEDWDLVKYLMSYNNV